MSNDFTGSVAVLSPVEAGDIELLGWMTRQQVGLAPIPRIPAMRAALVEGATAERALTLLPQTRRLRVGRR